MCRDPIGGALTQAGRSGRALSRMLALRYEGDMGEVHEEETSEAEGTAGRVTPFFCHGTSAEDHVGGKAEIFSDYDIFIF